MDRIDRFAAGLEAHEATATRTTAAAFEDDLADAIEPPAVGVPLAPLDLGYGPVEVTTDPTPRQLDRAGTGVTPAELGIADSGSILVTSGAEAAEAVSLYPPRHVAVLPASGIVPDVTAAFVEIEASLETATSAVLATGPSATADLGGLVYGAHGPRSVHVLVVTDR